MFKMKMNLLFRYARDITDFSHVIFHTKMVKMHLIVFELNRQNFVTIVFAESHISKCTKDY